jgi:integrase/recombinase XerD
MTELRRRMLEELQLRNHSHAERAYIRCLANFAKHFRTAPDRLGPEHIRNYQLFLVQQKKFSWGRSTKPYVRYVFSTMTSCIKSG